MLRSLKRWGCILERVIKFRGRSLRDNKFIYGYYTEDSDGSYIRSSRGIWIPVDKKTVGQFTGLYDKTKWEDLTEEERTEWTRHKMPSDWKGREVFEGDILVKREYLYFDNNVPNYVAVVEWCFAGFHTILQCVNPEKRGISTGINESLDDGTDFEILGNIYENPELLEGK